MMNYDEIKKIYGKNPNEQEITIHPKESVKLMRTILDEEKGYSVKLKPVKKECEYHFYQGDNQLKILSGKIPIALTDRMPIWKHIVEYSKVSLYIPEVQRKIMNDEIIPQLQEQYNNIIFEKENNEKQSIKKEERDKRKRIKDGKEFYNNLEEPLIYIGSIIDWLTAGERKNILTEWLCFCSQIILKEPISVVGFGDAATGKTHIQKTALNLIPEEYVIYEKNPSVATLSRHSEENPYFYDGLIVNYGDMGGQKDHEEAEAVKAIMKELQTEGFYSRPVTEKRGDIYEVVNLELYGRPALTYTTVPNYQMDDQELSRSIVINPRTDNNAQYDVRENHLAYAAGKSNKYLEEFIEPQIKHIKNMLLYLQSVFEEVKINNLFGSLITEILYKSPTFKRDKPKIMQLLKVITALNLKYHKIENNNIFTNEYDVKCFINLLSNKFVEVNYGINKLAAEIYNNIINNTYNLAADDLPIVDVEPTWTVNKYIKMFKPAESKRSVQNAFSNLNTHGLLEVVEKKQGTPTSYAVMGNKLLNVELKLNSLSDYINNKIMEYELDDFVQIPCYNGEVNIMSYHVLIKIPKW